MSKGTSATAWNASARDTIRQSDVLQFLVDTAAGIPAVRRDAAGRPIGHHEEPDMNTRIQVATTLLNRVLPTVAAQQLQLSGEGGDGTLKIIFGNGDTAIGPPGSGEPVNELEHKQTIDTTPTEARDIYDEDEEI